ncbi:MAG: type III secretion system chaperone [Acidobacteriota bacterium]|nr:type III secretion system chaperone [Blastocatellia bacterium]MDW8411280.1 type III secretion system chaperone [Acidobacteriota bacterium]
MSLGQSTPSSTSFAGLGRVGTGMTGQLQQTVTNPPVQEKKEDASQSSKQGQEESSIHHLLQQFGESIGLHGLEFEQNRCSLVLGTGPEAVEFTMELLQDKLCFYAVLDRNPEGIPANVKEHVANQSHTENGTFLALNSAGTTLFVCLNSSTAGLRLHEFETLVRNFYMAVNEWRRRYEQLRRPLSASTAMLYKPAAQDRRFAMERYLDKATGFLAIAYIIYRMGGILA